MHETGAGPDTITHVAALARKHDKEESRRLMAEVLAVSTPSLETLIDEWKYPIVNDHELLNLFPSLMHYS